MKIEVNEQELRVLEMALSEIPYKFAAPVVASILKQLAEQSPRGEQSVAPTTPPPHTTMGLHPAGEV